jgi:hypothetical protein
MNVLLQAAKTVSWEVPEFGLLLAASIALRNAHSVASQTPSPGSFKELTVNGIGDERERAQESETNNKACKQPPPPSEKIGAERNTATHAR